MSSLGNKQIMARNIKRYMDEFNVDRNSLCQSLGIKYTTLADWLNAKTYPRIDKIEMLSNYFHISKSDLVEEPSPAAPVSLEDPDADFIAKYHQLDAEDKRAIEVTVDTLLMNAKYQRGLKIDAAI